MKCINCHTTHEEKFCPNCGEKSSVERITFQSTITSVFSTVSNMDKGFLYNLKNLTISPKKTIESYIQGKRKDVFNPIAYAVLMITLYLILDSFIVQEAKDLTDAKLEEIFLFKLGYEVGKLLQAGYLKYFWLSNIIILSFFTRIFLKKYNYFEHLAISAFVVGHATFVGIISLLFFKSDIILNIWTWLVIVILLYHIFKEANTKIETILFSFLSTWLCYCCFFIVPIVFIFIRNFFF